MSATKRGETGDVDADWAEREEVGPVVVEKDEPRQDREKQARAAARSASWADRKGAEQAKPSGQIRKGGNFPFLFYFQNQFKCKPNQI